MQSILSRLAFVKWQYVVGALLLIAAAAYVATGKNGVIGTTLTVARATVMEQVSVTGTVTPAHTVDLGFAASGRIAGTYATVGQHVAAGTVLAETENGDLAAAVALKQAALAKAQAELASLLAGSTAAQVAVASTTLANATAALADAVQSAYTTADDAVHNKVDQLFTNPRSQPMLSFTITNALLATAVENDRATLEPVLAAWAASLANGTSDIALAQKDLAQVSALLADANAALNQAVPDQTTSAATLAGYATALAAARTNVNTAIAALTAAQSALDAAEKNLSLVLAGPTPDAVAASRASVAAAAADEKSAEAALAKTRVLAPFDGVVTRMDAKVGEIVSPSASQISMQSDGLFEIDTYVPEVSISNIQVGDSATTTLDAYGPAVLFPAKVVAVDPAETVKDGVPTYKTTLSFLAADPRIRSGMTANVVIETGVLSDAIVIPSGAVGSRPAGSYVTIVANGATENRAVTTGATPSLGQVEITAGLESGDTILLAPASP